MPHHGEGKVVRLKNISCGPRSQLLLYPEILDNIIMQGSQRSKTITSLLVILLGFPSHPHEIDIINQF